MSLEDDIQTININSYDIYTIKIIEKLNAINILETELLNSDSSDNEKTEQITKDINKKIVYIEHLYINNKTRDFINMELPIDNLGKFVDFDCKNIDRYVNPLIVFVNNFKLNWIKYKLINDWIENGGNIDNLYGTIYLIKKDLIYFINELSKNLSSIDKDKIKEYIQKNLYDLLDYDSKKRLNTFNVYSVIRNNINNNNSNKIYKIDKNDFYKIDKNYKLGINDELLKKEEINRIYNAYQIYYETLESSKLSPNIIIEYEKFLNLQNIELSEIEKKLSIIKTKYYAYDLSLKLNDPSYTQNRKIILSYYNFLNSVNYNLNKEQTDKIKTLNVKMNLDGKIPIEFKADNFFPLFYNDDLIKLKKDLLDNKDRLCGYIKNIFPLYSISYDLFCVIDINKERKYINKETIDRTINFYCVVLFVIGIINYQLKICNQDYMIILKGGKALQFILSEMNFKDDTIIKSNDIDLIIAPIDGKKYNMNKCKFLAINICLLIQWILNPTMNIYNKDYYVSYKTPIDSDEYKFVIKLSHKIKNYDNDIDSRFTAIADFDFNQIEKKTFYSDLVNTTKNTPISELTFIHQNLDNFLLEKIYYISLNIDLVEKNNLILDNKINNYNYINNSKEKKIIENHVQIKSFKEKIKELNINKLEKKIHENEKLVKKYYDKLHDMYIHLNEYKNYLYQNNTQENQIYFKELFNNYNKTNKDYELLLNKNKDISNNLQKNLYFKDDYNHQIQLLYDDNKKYSIEIKNNEEENDKILSDVRKNTKNAQRFINKFSYQVKSAAKIITKNSNDSDEISLNKQKEFINKLILDNQSKLEFDDKQVSKIISTIFT